MKFTYAELFAGIGGFHIGLSAAGGTRVFANEWDKYAAKTYSAWFGNEQLVVGDIREVEIRKQIPKHDLLCGGFPCQPFSIAGVSKKISLGREHGFQDKEQGNLYFEIIKIVKSHKPKVVFLENVKNLMRHDKGKTWEIIKNLLDKAGYEVKYSVIDASGWVPQRRRRVFIVAFSRSHFDQQVIDKFSFPISKQSEKKLNSILHRKVPDKKYMLSDALWSYLQNYSKKQKERGNGFGYNLVDRKSTAPTISARYYKDGAEILINQKNWKNPRKLTPREAARLMGFNSKYAKQHGFTVDFPIVVSDVQAYKQFGNAVCPQVIEAIAHEIARVFTLQRVLNAQRLRPSIKKVG